jgi:hypothetical protein
MKLVASKILAGAISLSLLSACEVALPGPPGPPPPPSGFVSLDLVDVQGYHHQGYYDDHHDWHGGYYDAHHQFHNDAHDWHR